jgi:alkaline phosphatase D
VSRRVFLDRLSRAALSAAAGLRPGPAPAQAPAVVTRDSVRPRVTHGVASGDVARDRAIVWSRADRPSRMHVEWATNESFRDARRVAAPAALAETGFTAHVDLAELPAGETIFYRVAFQDLSDVRVWSAPVVGRFRSVPAVRRDVKIAFTGDTCGQGWGINLEWGGLRLYETMRREQPDLLVHLGDNVYADQPIAAEVQLDDGTLWRNVVTPEKSKVAETLQEFRGNYLYNLMDEHVRRFNAEVPQIALWDDHEVRDNWYPTRRLETDARYREKSVALLAARAKRAFLEHLPIRVDAFDPERLFRSFRYGPSLEIFAIDMRSYRGANSPNRQAAPSVDTALLGSAQVRWLKERLAASTATWKLVASDMPIGVVVGDGPTDFEGVANRHDGPPLGRELEIASLLRFIRDRRIHNVVWITADIHYCAAHYYDPTQARFTEFMPFWEFVAGPAHAGTFGPAVLDSTFGPQLRFLGIPAGMKPNRPPSVGLQFFGTFEVDGHSDAARVRLHDGSGARLFEVELQPVR